MYGYLIAALVLLWIARSVWAHRKRRHEYHVVFGNQCVGHIHSDTPIVEDPRNPGIMWIKECDNDDTTVSKSPETP